ncbi:Gfo/Idh/MocA family oxidoreductase [Flavobacteriaceae bacterium]|nr:Gfo/Idh/MocA family oxidoreductase [Flavobacteriaceae bacterium]
MKGKTKVILIGLGEISYKYDYNLPKSYVLTHLRAFELHPSFEIIAVVDKNKDVISEFSSIYKYPTFISIREALKKFKPDLVVVSTSTSSHLDVVKGVFDVFSPKYLLCEKPLGANLNESTEIIELCKINKSILLVNFQRNSSVLSKKIKEKFLLGEFGPYCKIILWYSNGLRNSASHFISLFNYFFGKIKKIDLIDYSSSKENENDTMLNFKLKYEKCEVIFMPLDETSFFYNSFEMIFKNGRLLYENGGETCKWQKIDNTKKTYSNYYELSKNFENFESDFNQSQLSFVNNLAKFIKGEDCLICRAEDAFETSIIIEELINKKSEIR